MENGPGLKVYFLLKMGIPIAMLVCRRVFHAYFTHLLHPGKFYRDTKNVPSFFQTITPIQGPSFCQYPCSRWNHPFILTKWSIHPIHFHGDIQGLGVPISNLPRFGPWRGSLERYHWWRGGNPGLVGFEGGGIDEVFWDQKSMDGKVSCTFWEKHIGIIEEWKGWNLELMGFCDV